MADEQIEPKVDGIYRNRVYPNLVVRVAKVQDGFVTFQFIEGLREGYPLLDEPHVMRYRQFSRYYRNS